jgi:hypothetical protein
MAQTNFTPLKLYRSVTAGASPAAGNLADGELAINTNDQLLFFKNSSGQVVRLADSGTVTASIIFKTSNYTVVAADSNKILSCNPLSDMTLALTAAATIGAGFMVTVWNVSAYNVTIDPSGSQTIDGGSTLVLRQGEGLQIICDGSNWQTGNKKTMRAYVESYVAGSTRNSIAGSGSFAIGSGGSLTGSDSFCLGNNTYIFGSSATAIGYSASAAKSNATAIGPYAYAAGIGKIAFCNGFLSSSFDSQQGLTILKGRTTNATSLVLTTDGSSVGGFNTVLISQPGSAYAFSGLVVARQLASAGTQTAAWKVEGLIRREATLASTTLVASTVTAISNSPGWSVSLSADTTNGAMLVTVTGAASTNIVWVANIQAAETHNF